MKNQIGVGSVKNLNKCLYFPHFPRRGESGSITSLQDPHLAVSSFFNNLYLANTYFRKMRRKYGGPGKLILIVRRWSLHCDVAVEDRCNFQDPNRN